jgi:hypothetical protein
MNKLILQLIESTVFMESSPNVSNLVQEETHSLLTLFQEKEAALSLGNKSPSWEATQLTRVTKLIYELVSSLDALEDSSLSHVMWLTPTLNICMESKNETVRRNVLKLQQRMAKFIETSMAGPAVGTLDTTDESK